MTDKVEAIAKYDAAAGSGKVSITKGMIVTVIKRTETGWWYGQTPSGEKGYFPSTYVKEIAATDSPASPSAAAAATAVVTSGADEGKKQPKIDVDALSSLMSQMASATTSASSPSPSPSVRSGPPQMQPPAKPTGAAASMRSSSSSSLPTVSPPAPPTATAASAAAAAAAATSDDQTAASTKKPKGPGPGWVAAAAKKTSNIEIVLVPQSNVASTDPFRVTWDDELAREAFREFSYQEEAVEGIIFCEHVERWKYGMIPGCTREFANPEKILEEGRRIYRRYLDPDPELRKIGPAAELEVNVAGDVKANVAKKLGIQGTAYTDIHSISEDVFDAAVDDVLNYLKQGVFPRFLKSSHYDKYKKNKLLDAESW